LNVMKNIATDNFVASPEIVSEYSSPWLIRDFHSNDDVEIFIPDEFEMQTLRDVINVAFFPNGAVETSAFPDTIVNSYLNGVAWKGLDTSKHDCTMKQDTMGGMPWMDMMGGKFGGMMGGKWGDSADDDQKKEYKKSDYKKNWSLYDQTIQSAPQLIQLRNGESYCPIFKDIGPYGEKHKAISFSTKCDDVDESKKLTFLPFGANLMFHNKWGKKCCITASDEFGPVGCEECKEPDAPDNKETGFQRFKYCAKTGQIYIEGLKEEGRCLNVMPIGENVLIACHCNGGLVPSASFGVKLDEL